jgi:hypothetical protein
MLESTATMSEPAEPNGKTLSELLFELKVPESGIRLGDLDAYFGAKGPAFLIILLSLPFLIPMNLPGFSTIAGFGIIALTIKGLVPNGRLPKFLADRIVSANAVASISKHGGKVISKVEVMVKPRLSFMLNFGGKTWATILMIVCSLLLAIPVPPVIPLTNTLPAIAIICLAFAVLESDGLFFIVGQAMTAVTIGYFIFCWQVVVMGLMWIFDKFAAYTGINLF